MEFLDFTNYIEWLLDTLADFLMSEPVIYVFGLVITLFVIKIFKSLLSY